MNDTAYDFTGLRALFINCTLKKSPEPSNTQGLIDASAGILRKQGVTVDEILAIDHDLATGVWPDMTKHGWLTDEWPALYQRVLAEVEYPLVLASMTATRGNQIKAADLLGLNRNTLRKKIRDLDIQVYRSGG